MPFLETIKEMVDGVEGGLAATIMGTDGLSVQKYAKEESACDVETVGVEYGKVIDEVRHASTLLNLGDVEEITVSTHGTYVLLKMVTPEYYIAFVIEHKANIGRARYLLKKAAARAKEEL